MRLVSVDTGSKRPIQDGPRFEYVTPNGSARVVHLEAARSVPFEMGAPARAIPSRPGQRHTPGWYSFTTTGVSIAYESDLERRWLTMLDFDPEVVAVLSQPFRILGPVIDGWLDHVPDFFARLSDGSGCVVDVKHPSRVNDQRVVRQRELTETVCNEAGFSYRFVSELSPQRWANVSWLSGYRRQSFVGVELVERVCQLAQRPIRLVDLCALCDEEGIMRAVVFHLCWRQQLVFDLDRPLRDDTLIKTGDK